EETFDSKRPLVQQLQLIEALADPYFIVKLTLPAPAREKKPAYVFASGSVGDSYDVQRILTLDSWFWWYGDKFGANFGMHDELWKMCLLPRKSGSVYHEKYVDFILFSGTRKIHFCRRTCVVAPDTLIVPALSNGLTGSDVATLARTILPGRSSNLSRMQPDAVLLAPRDAETETVQRFPSVFQEVLALRPQAQTILHHSPGDTAPEDGMFCRRMLLPASSDEEDAIVAKASMKSDTIRQFSGAIYALRVSEASTKRAKGVDPASRRASHYLQYRWLVKNLRANLRQPQQRHGSASTVKNRVIFTDCRGSIQSSPFALGSQCLVAGDGGVLVTTSGASFSMLLRDVSGTMGLLPHKNAILLESKLFRKKAVIEVACGEKDVASRHAQSLAMKKFRGDKPMVDLQGRTDTW
ncbi:uncharacterized protein DEA37_0002214, partial [Paragonimus westermani]